MKANFTSYSDTRIRISSIDVEFATAIVRVINFLQSIAQDPKKTQNLNHQILINKFLEFMSFLS